MRNIVILIALLLPMMAGIAQNNNEGSLSDKDKAYLDSLDRLSFNKFGTYAGLVLQDSVIVAGNRLNAPRYSVQAVQDKASTYFNLGLYNKLDMLIDSIDAHSNYRQTFTRLYYRIRSTHINSLARRGYFRMASKGIERFVAEADSLESNSSDSISSVTALSVRIMAISMILESDMQLKRSGPNYLDKATDLVKGIKDSYPEYLKSVPVEYFGLLQDFFRLNHSNYEPGADSSFVQEYIEAFDMLKEYARPVNVESKRPLFEFYLSLGRSVISRMNDKQTDAWKNMQNVANLIRKYPKLRNAMPMLFQDRLDYEVWFHNYDKALSYSDSLMPYYGQYVNARAKSYWNRRMQILMKLQRYSEAADAGHKALEISDSLSVLDQISSNEELSTMLGLEMAETQSNMLKSDLELAEHKSRVSYLIAVSSLLMGALLFISVIVYQNRKHSRKLEKEVDRQTSELKEKSRDITDSINYAQRIQSAMLPDLDSFVGHGLSGASVFYKPRNVVSGDFYWAHQYSQHILIACADCTGHGIPGAFMSMIGTTLLNDICHSRKIFDPAIILESLDSQLISVLSMRNANEVEDGMDITIMSLDLSTHKLLVSSSRRPFFYIHEGVLTEFKGVKRSIGEHERRNRVNAFVNHSFDVSLGDRLYMYSDGLADQYGGQDRENPLGRRLKSSGMKDFVEQLSKVAVNRQSDEADRLFEKWKGTCPQVDDISMVVVQF